MKIIYSDMLTQNISDKPSIFLAGCTRRCLEHPSWRSEALQLFELNNFDGYVCIPEYQENLIRDWNKQVEWEWYYLHAVDIILFWVPRKFPDFKGMTTNVELGYYLGTRKNNCIYGRPDGAEQTGYLDWLYKKTTNLEPFNNLSKLVKETVSFANTVFWQNHHQFDKLIEKYTQGNE